MPPKWQEMPVTYNVANKKADIVISLGQQTYPALSSFLQKYSIQKKLNIVLESGSCGVTAGKLRHKSIDIGAYCCPVGANDRLPNLKFHTIGIAPISLVTHPDNPIQNLSLLDARKVFHGSFSRWSELPGNNKYLSNRKIQPVVRLHCKKRPGHWTTLLKNEDQFSPRLYEVGVIPDVIHQVASNPLAIGFETLYMLRVHRSQGELKTLSIDGINANDLKSAALGHYPIYRTYSLSMWGDSKKSKVALEIIHEIEKYIELNSKQLGIVPVRELRENGWKFNGDELIAEPYGARSNSSKLNR